jgi:arylsulfatase A-like enzyme
MPRRPNILVVITHDSGRRFGCLGAGVDTPHVDRLAEQGALFTRAFCTAPQCSPARASAWTGLYPHRHGLIGLAHLGFRPHPETRFLPSLLREAGYRTALFGFQHEAPNADRLGYDEIRRGDAHSTAATLPLLREFLDNPPPTPFYACVGLGETHRPFPAAGTPDEPATVTVPGWLPDDPVVRADLADLHGMIRRVDRFVGEVDELLDRTGLADNTLLLYTTDHGVAFPRAKGTLRDAGLGVMLAARGPGGFDGGKRIDRLASTMDLTPTLLELARADIPDGLDGRSLLPLLRDAGAPWRDHLFAELTYHTAYDPMRAVRTERFKYIRSFEDRPMVFLPHVDAAPTKDLVMQRGEHRVPRPAELLYDLAHDPFERTNLSDDTAYAGVLAHLRNRVERWMRETGDPLACGPVAAPPGAHVTPAGSVEPVTTDAGDDWRAN